MLQIYTLRDPAISEGNMADREGCKFEDIKAGTNPKNDLRCVYMISHGASNVNTCFVVHDDDAQKSVCLLHEQFFPTKEVNL